MSEGSDDWLSHVRERFRGQLRRADALVNAAAVKSASDTAEFVSAESPESDILRAAVVLLHAALEDLVRSIQRQRLPYASVDVLNHIEVPMPHGAPKGKVGLGVFAEQFRGLTVSEAVQVCVDQHLERATFNNPDDLARGLREVGVDEPASLLGDDAGQIKLLTARRHRIAHRADDDSTARSPAATTRLIALSTVVEWSDAVRRVGERIVTAVHDLEKASDDD